MNENGDRDFRTNCPRPPQLHALFTVLSTAKVLSHSDVLEISQICTSCMRPAHESCRPETERLHVQSSVPIVSKLSLGGGTLVAVNMRDVHHVEQATFGCQATVCTVRRVSYVHSRGPVPLLARLFSCSAWLAERARVANGAFRCMSSCD